MIATHLYHASLADCTEQPPAVYLDDKPRPALRRRRHLWPTRLSSTPNAAAPRPQPQPQPERSRSPLRDYFAKKSKTAPTHAPSAYPTTGNRTPCLQYNLDEQAAARICPQHQSPLLSLPAELRLAIYEHALLLPTPDAAPLRHFRASEQETKGYSVLALLETCRLVHAEAERIFFAINWLAVDAYSRFNTFGDSVGEDRLRLVRNVSVRAHSWWHLARLARMLRHGQGIESIRVSWQKDIGNVERGIEPDIADELQTALVELKALRELVFVGPDVQGKSESDGEFEERLAQLRETEGTFAEWVRVLAKGREAGLSEDEAVMAAEYGVVQSV